MMAPDRRRRSPEGSSISRRHRDPRADYNEPAPRMRATPQSYPYSSSSSSSSSNSIIDISHSFPPKRSGIRTFFTAPSERKLRKRRSSRLMKNSNSSSSSVNSDLAYGHGYIKRPKLRRVRSRSGREIDRERHGDRYNERHNERQSDRYNSDREGGKLRNNERARESAGSSGTGTRGNLGTTAGILAVGAGLRAIAAEQNKRDLREARNGKKPELSSVRDSGGNSYIESRGLGPSRPSHGPDEDGWESASDSESSVDSRLAFGNDTNSGWGFFGKKKYKPMSRKSSIVDPRLFGPENSLHGVVTQPVGFGDVAWASTSDFGDQREAYHRDSYSTAPQQSYNSSSSQVPLQNIPPMPMSDVDRNEPPRYTSEPQGYNSVRPDPVPIQIQHPKPRTPVSQSVYEPFYPARSEPIYHTRSESGGILKKTNSSTGRGKSLAGAAVAGVAAAAVGSMISSARDDRKDRQREDEIEALERDRLRRRDSDKRDSKDEKRDKRSSPPREDRKDKRRDKDKDKDKEDTEERRREKKREERRGETRDEKEDRREKRREERRATDRSDDKFDSRRTKSEASVSTTSVDPFQYQVDQNAFPTPTIESSSGHKRIESVPTVVTVERVPDFSRKRSSSIKSQPAVPVSESRKDFSSSQRGFTDRDDQEQRYRQASEPGRQADWDEKERRNRGGERRDRVLHDAEDTIQDAKHFTGPYEAAVVTAVVAAEHHRETRADERRRERQKDANYNDYSSTSRDKTPARDPIQEEADRAYREIVMARKIASQVIRSRSPSPDPSVIHKYENKEQPEEIIRIVTPPGMEEHKGKGPYDAPNADFRLDHVLEHPKDLQIFSRPSFGQNRSIAEPIRDPDASKPRPHLNLVRPTPTPSPMPEKQVARSEPGRKTKSKKDRDTPNRSSSSDIVIGPKGNIIASPTVSNVSKGVTWGENETKHFEVESPSEHRDEFVSKKDVKSRDSTSEPGTPKGDKGWGAVAAGIVGAGVGATVASEISKSSKSQENDKPVPYEYRGVVVEPESPARRDEYRGVVVEPESPPRKQRQRSPPSPGPKPTMSQSSHSNHMPGAFDDDLDFTATVAAGLQDTGFDPNIVIDDPTFRRRDSPPGSNDHGFYQAPFAETVTDLGMNPSEISRTRGTEGFVIGEVASTPKDWPVVSPTENDDSYSKLSKTDQKKRDKALKRQSGDPTPTEESSTSREVVVEPESYFEAPLSKKEQKKRDKAAKRQGSQTDDITPFSEPSVAADIVQEPESYFETPKKSKKSKGSSTYDDSAAESPRDRTVSVPVNAFDDLQNGEDEWADSSKKSKKKSKRDSDRYDSPVRSAATETASEIERSSSKKSKRDSERYESPARSAPSSDISSSGKKSKDKSNRRSGQFDFDPSDVALPPSGTTSEISSVSKKSKDKSSRRSEQYEYDPAEVSLPPTTPSEMGRDGEYEDARSTRRSSTRDSGIFNSEDRGDSRSVVSTGTSRTDDQESRKKKKSRSSTADFDDTRSVASAPAGDDYDDKKGKKKDKKSGGIFSGFFGGSKSEVGARDESPKGSKDDFEDFKKKSKKSKKSSASDGGSLYGDMGSASVNDLSRSISNGHSNGNGNGSYAYDDGNDDGARSDGEKKKKTRARSESTSSKKDSFLGKAGTLGAGVGIAGVTVAAIAAHHHQQSKAENTNSNVAIKQSISAGSDKLLERDEVLDPEITQRHFRPSIDPQYGDLLPLPPSDPASPNVEPLDDLPNLPDSRPGTPESERLAREKVRNVARRSVQETPMKSPSHSQVPLKFKMGGNRSVPPSPGAGRSSPLPSPANPGQETLFPRQRSRPSSWDNSKEFKPLYLVESTRRGSKELLHADDELLPELPPSQRTSRSSSQLTDSDKTYAGIGSRGIDPLSIDTRLASASNPDDFLGSGQSTPKANAPRGFEDIVDSAKQDQSSDPTTQLARSSSPKLEKSSGSFGEEAAKMAVAAGLVSTIGYFASTASHPKTNASWLDDLPSAKDQSSSRDLPTNRQLSPVDSLPSGEPRPSPVDAVTKDRSSYLLRSSPMSKKYEDVDSNDGVPGSPSGKSKPSADRDTLHSIQERDLGDVDFSGLPHDVDSDREKTLETLSGGKDFETQQPSQDIEEPSDEFALKKSKKDKKKDKKGKGLSRSGTQDDMSMPESSTSQIPDAFSTIEAEPAESFSKSKKDKKNKKKSNPISWDDNEPVAQQADEPSLQVKAEEPDSDTFFDAEQDSFEPPAPEEKPVQQEDFSTPKGKKGKKDKKGKSKFAWEPEPEVFEESLTQQLQNISEAPLSREVEPVNMPSSVQIDDRSLDEHANKLSDVVPTEIPTSAVESTADAPFDDFSSSKKKGKKDKRKSKITSDWDEPQDQPDLPDPSIEHTPTVAESNPAEDFFTSVSKKDKKKDKKKGKATPWEHEEATPEINSKLTETSQDLQGDKPGNDDNAQFDDFTTPKSTGKKNKKSKAAAWEPEPDSLAENELPTSASATRDLPDDVSTPVEDSQPIDEFSFMSKKDKKKKQKGKSVSSWDVEDDATSQSTPVPVSETVVDSQEIPTPAEEPFEEFSSVKKKGKKDKKKSKSLSTWEEPDDVSTQLASEPMHDRDALAGVSSSTQDETLSTNVESTEKQLESANPSLPETRDEVSTNDDFGFNESKKSKKKKGKASMNWADEVESSIPEPSPATQLDIGQSSVSDTLPVDDFESGFVSKKDKKKKNKSAAIWEADQEITLPQSTIDTEEPVFTTSSSKKDKKKKGRNLQQWDEPETSQDQLPVGEISRNFDSSALTTERNSNAPPSDEDKLFSGDPSKTLSTDEMLSAQETPLTRPTPLGGPGGWPITPATPLTSGEQLSGEIPNSTSKGYFPAAAAAVSAAIFGSRKSRDDSSSKSKEPSMEEQSTTSFGTDEPPRLETEPKSSPDGLTAGYDDTQLSLARQLQEEFGKKSSKKDKKKRQSLPSTPEILHSRSNSRSRNIDDDNEESIRTRSLSIGPASDRSGISPATSERKNVYSEDQLEAARQMKADFESGSKKSKDKKSKKGRSSKDDDLFDKDFSDPQTSASTSKDIEGPVSVFESSNPDVVKPDGFAAGYQEDQLSLARQMQAEFAKKASKKDSKKDKKRRSTSQPPDEQESQHDESEHPTQFSGGRSTQDDDLPVQSQSIADDNLPARDGLAVGYTAEQLEIARQMKEDFGSGSKKKGKDKKDKKRGSLLRTNTEDDFSSDPMSGDIDSQQDFDASQPIETPDADDDFSTFGKKSKKKEKNGKRGSLLPSTPDPELPGEEAPFGAESLAREDGPSHNITGEELSAEPGSMEPEVDSFYSMGKKDKKSKKGKKSLYAATDDDAFESPEPSEQIDEESSSKAPLTEPVADPEDDFAFSTKKSKKDKKKRQSSTIADDFPDQQIDDTRDIPSEESSSKSPLTDPVAEPEDDFAFSTKKSKKDKKKRQSSTIVDEFPDQQINDTRDTPSEELPVSDPVSPSPVDDEAGDDFGFSSKKKDKKKKRGSLLRNESFNANNEEQSEDVESTYAQDNQIEPVSPPVNEPPQDDFEFSTKKSKKDKKKRGSLLRNESFNAFSEEQSENPESVPAPDSQIEAPIPSPVDEPLQDEFELTSKKSKKDKKKRGSLLRNESFNANAENEVEASGPSNADVENLEELSSAPAEVTEGIALNQSASQEVDQNPEDLFEDIAFTKKSKKKDKKRKDSTKFEDSSETSTSLDPVSELKISDEPTLQADLPLEAATSIGHEEKGLEASIDPIADQPDDDWGDFSTKKSKKKKRKDSSKPDPEEISIPSEPILEPSRDVALTPLPLDHTSEDNMAPEQPLERDLQSTATPANGANLEEPADEWSSFSVKKSKKDKKKQKGSFKEDFEGASGTASPVETIPEPIQSTSSILPDTTATNTVDIEQPRTLVSDDLTPIATQEPEEPEDDWGSFSTKKSKKGKKDKKSGSSTPIVPIVAAAAAIATLPSFINDDIAPTSSREVDVGDDWGNVSSKKSKKGKKDKKSDYSTPVEDELPLDPALPSLESIKEPSLSADISPDVLEQAAEGFKESHEDPSAVNEEPAVTDTFDEWGSVPAKKSKDKKKKRGSGFSTPIEETLVPVPEQLAEEDLGQSSTFKQLDRDAPENIQPIDTVIATEEQGDEWGDFSSKKSKKKDKKSKKSGLSTPSEELPSSDKGLPTFDPTDFPTDAVADTAAPDESHLDTKDVGENQEDDWASLSTKPSKKDRKKQKSSLSTPAETIPDPKLEDQSLETAKSSENQPTDENLQSEQRVDVEPSEVVEDPTDDWGASFVKPSKKSKKDKSKRSSGVSTPIDQTPEPLSERDIPASDQPSIQPALNEQVSEPSEQAANTETRDVIDEQDEWNFSAPKSKKDKKKSRKSGISTPIEEPLLQEESASLPADSVEQVPSFFDTPEATSSGQNVDFIDEQDEWSFSAPKTKKDKKKSRKSGISTPIEEPLPNEELMSVPADSVQEVPSSFDTPEATSSGQKIDAIDEQDEWSFSAPKSKKDKKKSRKSGTSTPVTESLPLPETEAPPEQSQTFDASLNNARELTQEMTPVIDSPPLLQTEALPEQSQVLDSILDSTREIARDTTEDTFNDPSEEWGSSSKKSKDKKKKKSEQSTPAAENLSSLPSLPPAEPTEHLEAVVDETPFPANDPAKDLVDDNQEDEWGTSSKKKKKDKKNKKLGLLTPVEEPALPVDHRSFADSVRQPSPTLFEAQPPSKETEVIVEPQAGDEWASLPTKKGKKDKKGKKGKSGTSTPAEEISTGFPEQEKLDLAEPSIVPAPTSPNMEESPSRDIEQKPDVTEEVVDDWGSFTKKKSKKDKKGKSGLSTPVEEVQTSYEIPSQSKDIANQPDVADSQTIETDLPISDNINTELLDQQPEDDSFGFESKSSKKSKKDKKRKSALSTPIEEVQTSHGTFGQSKKTDNPAHFPDFETTDRDLQTSHETNTELPDQQPEEDAFAFATKSSKKSKKDKRKSGISTPVEEAQIQDQFGTPSDAATKAEISGSQEDLQKTEESQSQSLAHDADFQAQQPSDGDFSFTPAKSKAKKGRKASRAGSDSAPSTPVQPDLFTSLEPEKSLSILGRDQVTSPVAFETTAEEGDLFTSDLSRKLSKKDKKKRHAAFDLASEGQDQVTVPSTSWADEIEEATVVRAVPIIEDIGEDQSLSHIAPTVESIPMDDFVRPSKKGKKGTKRNSISSQFTPITETHPSSVSRDLPSSPAGSSSMPAIIASGAAIAGAALLSGAGAAMKSPTSETTTPAKKLSKKDKKKKSIDRRAPREEDIFDDPALWEGADPKAHEEAREIDDDSDGFWSPPQQEEEPAAIEEVIREAPTKEDGSISNHAIEAARPSSPISLVMPESHSSDTRNAVTEDHPPPSQDSSEFRNLPELSREPSDPVDIFAVSSSKKKDKKKKKNTSSSWDFEGLQNKEAEQPVNNSPAFDSPKSFGGPVGRSESFDQSQIHDEHIFTPTRDLLEPQHNSRDAPTSPDSSRNIPTERPQSRSFHSRLSDLPIVHEEGLESDYHHDLDEDANRDSAFVTGSPIPQQRGFSDDHEHVRDSGVHLRDLSPAVKTRAPVKSSDDALERLSWPSVDEDSETVDLHRSQSSRDTQHHIKNHIKEQPSSGSHDSKRPKGETATDFYQAQRSTPTKHYDEETTSRDLLPSQRKKDEQHTDLHRTPTIHGPRKTEGQSLVKQRLQQFQQSEPADLPRTPRPKLSSSRSSEKIASQISDYDKYSETPSSRSLERSKAESRKDSHYSDNSLPRSMDISKDDKHPSTPSRSERPKEAKYSELNSSPRPKAERSKGISDLEAGAAIAGATLGFAAARKHSQEQRPESAQSQRSASNTNINRLRTPDIHRPDSSASNRSGTPPLRRSDRKSGDLRSLSQRSKSDLAKEAELATSANSASAVNTANPTANEGRARAKDMADVYDGFGEGRMGSPRSPTRPHSMRRRQSMQVLDLEQKLEQLAAENRMLAEAKAQADHALQSSQNAPSSLVEKDAEIDSLKRTLEWLQNEVTRLSEVNDGLTSANMTIARQHGDQYGILESQHSQTARELQDVRAAHDNLSSGMEGIVRNEVQKAVLDKDREIAQLRAELDAAKEKIRDMQRQILASKANDVEFLTIRDEDYFDNACQQLCQHVQQWVLRFSKFSDMRACRLTSEINNDKTIDRLDNAILDGSDVDNYLADRVKRRDVFMSMTMTMVWEFIFTRYLFGMDREQRQKLKSLEKTLSEVGPASAVHQWRATTLTLLAKREAFRSQREQDTQAVVHAVLETLSEILPPPSHLETQIEEQLMRVMKAAVDLSIEMRCQRAEYMMLPPLQPEYDANGDLASKVSFNAALMNERSGDTVSNEDLENQKAVVRVVLFPLVVKKGDDSGEGDEEIVVCPAQVLVAKPKKSVRLVAPESNTSRMSLQSSMPAGDSVI